MNSYASIGAVLMSKRVASGLRDASGFWKHGHTYQAHPIACAASLAVQQVIIEEKLLENVQVQGPDLGRVAGGDCGMLTAAVAGEGPPLADGRGRALRALVDHLNCLAHGPGSRCTPR